MSAKRLLMTALVAVTTLTASALAQKNELTGIIGRTFISDQGVKNSNLFDNNVHFGKGLTFEINYGRHLMGKILRASPSRCRRCSISTRISTSPPTQSPAATTSYFVTPSLRANAFATTAISPWVSFGGGIGHFNPADHLEFGGPNPAPNHRPPESSRWASDLDVRVTPPSPCVEGRAISGQVRPISWSIPARVASITSSSVAE